MEKNNCNIKGYIEIVPPMKKNVKNERLKTYAEKVKKLWEVGNEDKNR